MRSTHGSGTSLTRPYHEHGTSSKAVKHTHTCKAALLRGHVPASDMSTVQQTSVHLCRQRRHKVVWNCKLAPLSKLHGSIGCLFTSTSLHEHTNVHIKRPARPVEFLPPTIDVPYTSFTFSLHGTGSVSVHGVFTSRVIRPPPPIGGAGEPFNALASIKINVWANKS